MMKRKAQGAVGAAILVAIIAVLVILYVMFLPPSEREALFEEYGEEIEAEVGENITLLEEFPGRLDYIAQKEIEHSLPAVNLNIFTESKVIKELDHIYVSKSLFGEKKANISFDLESPEDVEELMLNFVVRKADGRLIINLNGFEVHNKEIESINIEPIKIREHLRERNTLTFKVSSPGVQFWDTNEYSLEDILLIKNVINREAQESRVKFIISPTEKNNLDKASLKIFPECDIRYVGKLDIFMNGFNLYSAIPDCGAPMPSIEFPAEYLTSGENELMFKTERGKYLIYQIRVKSFLRSLEYPVYYFELSQEEYDDIKAGDSDVILTLRFPDAVDYKNGKVLINGHAEGIDQQGIIWEEDISEWIVKGNNAVKIEPRKTLDIVELTAVLEE
jgi:hypothetical protein